jgi:hypothetical protein
MAEVVLKKTRVATELVKEDGEIFIILPSKKIGLKGKVPLVGTINDVPFSLEAMPWKGDHHAVKLHGALKSRFTQDKDGHVVVEFEIDTSKHLEVHVPEHISELLGTNYEAFKKFDELTYVKKAKYIEWLEKPADLKIKNERLEKFIPMLLANKLP